MSGIALIIKGADFSAAGNNLGKVTILEDIAVENISINGPSNVKGIAKYSVRYTPEKTNQQGVSWNITEGQNYATINENGELTVLPGADNNKVTIQAISIYNEKIIATQQITVKYVKLPSSIIINGNNNVAGLSEKYTLTFKPDDTTEKDVVWSIENGGEDVTINQDGKISIGPNAQGLKVKIKATSVIDSSIFGEKEVMCTYWIGDANPIVYDLTNCVASTKPAGIENDSSVTVVLAPSDGYSMPRKVSVEGANIVSYDVNTGKLIINNPTGAVKITASGINAASEVYFVDEEVKRICTENYDADGDGKVTYAELAKVTNIGATFKGNTNIVNFEEFENFTSNKNQLTNHEFHDCTSLKSIKLPSQIKNVGYHAFENCQSLETIDLSNVTTLGDSAFFNCKSLKSVKFANNLQSIANSFKDCSALENVILPDSVTSITGNAFCDCFSIKEVHLSNSLTDLRSDTFAKNYCLQKINIPKSLTYIPSAFTSSGQDASTNGGIIFTCDSETPATFKSPDSDPFGWHCAVKQIRVPASAVSAYKEAPGWKLFADRIVANS